MVGVVSVTRGGYLCPGQTALRNTPAAGLEAGVPGRGWWVSPHARGSNGFGVREECSPRSDWQDPWGGFTALSSMGHG